MATTKIEWADMVWNPVTGCDPVSEGCRNCYAKRFAKRLQAMGLRKYRNGFQVTVHPGPAFVEPIKIKKPKKIFVCSMSDLFHPAVPGNVHKNILEVITQTPRHTYFILTKRPERIPDSWAKMHPDNLWMGVSVENQKRADERIPTLVQKVKKNRFISCEPILGYIDLEQSAYKAGLLPESEGLGVDWVIAGGETGPGARLTSPHWIINLYHQCKTYNVPFFFKQWGRLECRCHDQSSLISACPQQTAYRFHPMPQQHPPL